MGTSGLEERVAVLEEAVAQLQKDKQRLQKANDILEIQNVMSMHEYYHGSSRHAEELDAIFVKETPGISMEEAMLNGRYIGIDAVREYYVEFFGAYFKLAEQQAREIFPELMDAPETESPHGLQILHTLTTPVIEVAGDGETAKGVWLSPGFVTQPVNGRIQALWWWDRYAIDFAKEQGKWKIWHFWVGKEFSTPYEKSWVESAVEGWKGVQLNLVAGFPKPNAPSGAVYEGYSPFRAARFVPIPPVPYETFSETFSY